MENNIDWLKVIVYTVTLTLLSVQTPQIKNYLNYFYYTCVLDARNFFKIQNTCIYWFEIPVLI